ncbi:unnamed protein product, partial [Ectocarpus sp. 8 AP-2014]
SAATTVPEAATSGGTPMKAADVFPDLHHKMSKKIAQLTKVIYHLNTKNEDRQVRVQGAAAEYLHVSGRKPTIDSVRPTITVSVLQHPGRET